MATISEQLKYILTLDASQATKSFQQVGSTADKELGKADAKLDKLGATFTKVGAGAVAFAGIAGAGLFKLAQGAANTQASFSSLNQVVGSTIAEGLADWAKDGAENLGLAEGQIFSAATAFGSLGKMAGFAGEDLDGFIRKQLTLAADMAAFADTSPDQVIQDLRAAYAGSSETLQKYNVFVNDTNIKAAIQAATGEKVTGVLTSQQRVLGINLLLTEQTADMQGQWNRESGELAGQQAQLSANLKNLADNIGAGVLPMVTQLVGGINKAAEAFASLSPETQSMIGQFAGIGVAGVGLIGTLSLVAGQVIKMRTRFVDSTGALTAFGKAAKGVGIAMGVLAIAAAAYAVYSSEKAKATARTEEFVAALKAEAGGQEDASAAVLAARFAHEDYQAVMADTGLTAADLAAFIRGDMTSAMQAYVDSIDAATPAGQLFIGALESQRDSLTEAERKVAAEAAALKDLAPTTDKAVDATEDLTGATDELTEATGYGTLAQEEHATATDNWKLANEAATEADKEAADVAKAHTDAINAQVDALVDLVGGDIAVRDAQLAATEAVADATMTQDKQATALINAATAAATYDEKLGEAAGVTLDAQGKSDLLKQKLEELAATLAPGSALRQQIQGYIDDLNRIPESRETRVFITGSGTGGTGQGPIRAPEFAQGGTVPGPIGAPTLAIVHGGEEVIPVNGNGNGHGSVINNYITAGMGANGAEIGDIIVGKIREYERRNGPNWRR